MIKLSKRDIKVGDKVSWKEFNDESYEILNIDGDHCKLKHKINGHVYDYSLMTLEELIKNTKVYLNGEIGLHEYSPVQMTGHYRTIGD